MGSGRLLQASWSSGPQGLAALAHQTGLQSTLHPQQLCCWEGTQQARGQPSISHPPYLMHPQMSSRRGPRGPAGTDREQNSEPALSFIHLARPTPFSKAPNSRDTQISAVPWCCLVLATLSIPVSRQGCTNTSQPAELLELEALSICGAIQRDSGSYTPMGCTEKGLCRDITLPLDLERCSALSDPGRGDERQDSCLQNTEGAELGEGEKKYSTRVTVSPWLLPTS